LLWSDEPLEWELLDRPGSKAQRLTLNGDEAVELLNGAVSAATSLGLPWPAEPLTLQPSAELLKLVRLSQQEAAKEGAEAEV
jgi:CRISPR-associated protein Csb1